MQCYVYGKIVYIYYNILYLRQFILPNTLDKPADKSVVKLSITPLYTTQWIEVLIV